MNGCGGPRVGGGRGLRLERAFWTMALMRNSGCSVGGISEVVTVGMAYPSPPASSGSGFGVAIVALIEGDHSNPDNLLYLATSYESSRHDCNLHSDTMSLHYKHPSRVSPGLRKVEAEKCRLR